jgi:hypothetical protein
VDEKVVFAPQKSVISFAGVNKVFTVKDNKAVEINVDPGEVNSISGRQRRQTLRGTPTD